MKEAYVDANVILRFLTKDPPEMAEAALNLFTDAKNGKVEVRIIPITVAEVVWVLESFYGYSKQEVATVLTEFLASDGLHVADLNLLMEGLAVYEAKNIDFADALLGVTVLRSDASLIYSFDPHFDRIAGVKRAKPGEIL